MWFKLPVRRSYFFIVLNDMGVLTYFTVGGLLFLLSLPKLYKFLGSHRHHIPKNSRNYHIQEIKALADCHETAAVLTDLIHNDGADSWPPFANHACTTWPEALLPYKEIYLEISSLLPQETPSLDDEVNKIRIADFRSNFRRLLRDRVDLTQVKRLLEASDSGQWDLFPRDTYNAFYCCIAWSRHAYRWATIPVVRVAQLETVVDLPKELAEPWTYLQRHFGCTSQSGNNTSNLVLNFDVKGRYVFKINTGMSRMVLLAEEAFARIFYDVELLVSLTSLVYVARSSAFLIITHEGLILI